MTESPMTFARSSDDYQKWILAAPNNPCILEEQTDLSAPNEAEDCSSYTVGSMAINLNKWSEDGSDWMLFCDNRVWSRLHGGFRRTDWELIGQDSK